MATAKLPPSAAFLTDSATPTLVQARVLRRLAAQDVAVARDLLAAHRDAVLSDDVARAVLAFALGYHADAAELVENSKDAFAQALLGLIYADLDEAEEAEALFAKAAGKLPEAVFERVRALVALGRLDEANEIVDALDESAEVEFLGGVIAEAEGRVERAISCYEGALEREAGHVEAAFKLAGLLDRIGDDDMAIEYYLVCADNYPHYLPGVINLGILYDERGEANAAIDCFRQVLAYNPGNERARLLLRDAQASRTMYYDEREEREREKMEKILKTSVNDFELSVRSRNCLAKMDIFTLGDLISISEQEMLNYKNFGETSLREVKEMLDARNLRLGMLREDDERSMSKADQKVMGEGIERLELSSRSAQVLESVGVGKVGDVLEYSDLDLYRTNGSGQSVVQELSTALGAYGMYLKRPEVR
ncbi:MAG: DNA-directed RNA polymerase subunit alpha C-terminal domain-containing protein [Planctomycetota bacterium]|jgi:DNA-directed RNA polymerase subunit alpha